MHDMKQFLAVLSSFVVTLGHLAAQAEKSNDPVGAAWDHFNAARYDEGLAGIAKAMATLEPEAKTQATAMRGFDAKDHERERGALNAAGTLSLMRARILEKQGREREAVAAYLCAQERRGILRHRGELCIAIRRAGDISARPGAFPKRVGSENKTVPGFPRLAPWLHPGTRNGG